MNPPGGFDAKGHPYRREDDIGQHAEQAWALWAKLMFFHRGKVIAIATALASLVSCVATAVGMRYVGPKQEIERVERKVDTLAVRVSRVEEGTAEAREARAQINTRLDLVIYMQCVQMRRTDPAAVPRTLCDEARKP